MIVRKGGFDDIPELLVIAKRAHALSQNRHLEFDDDGARLLAANSMTTKGACLFVAVDDRVRGAILGLEQEYGYLRASYAIDIATFAETPAAARALVERFETWAFHDRRCSQVVLGMTFGGRHARAMGHLYTRAGFTSSGGVYIKNAPVRAEARTS